MSRQYYSKDKLKYSYDYKKQVWIIDGVYADCGHVGTRECDCYGHLHRGEKAVITEHCQ